MEILACIAFIIFILAFCDGSTGSSGRCRVNTAKKGPRPEPPKSQGVKSDD